MTDNNSNPPRPKRPWYQYSLRTLFAVTTVFAVGLGVIVHRVRRQRDAIDVIVAAEGYVLFDYHRDSDDGWYMGNTPPGPSWLPRWLREGLLADVVFVSLSGPGREYVPSGGWGYVPHGDEAGTSRLWTEYLEPRRQISHETLACLAKLPRLRRLSLESTTCDDDALKHLLDLESLKELNLDRTLITDAGLVHLTEVRNLESLYLSWNTLSDAGLQHLREMRRLQRLRIEYTHITEQGFEALQRALPQCAITWCRWEPAHGNDVRPLAEPGNH